MKYSLAVILLACLFGPLLALAFRPYDHPDYWLMSGIDTVIVTVFAFLSHWFEVKLEKMRLSGRYPRATYIRPWSVAKAQLNAFRIGLWPFHDGRLVTHTNNVVLRHFNFINLRVEYLYLYFETSGRVVYMTPDLTPEELYQEIKLREGFWNTLTKPL